VFRRRDENRPSKQDVINELSPDAKFHFFNDLATSALLNPEFDRARELLERVVVESEAISVIRPPLTIVAKIAMAGDFPDIANEALLAARISTEE